mmetsp:Transcript_20706/g.57832  ORF Transcript_20706/g.57832 Transcript_20706/m.57832 type:complete len:382 (+) Transcript_20706:119-1264(+)
MAATTMLPPSMSPHLIEPPPTAFAMKSVPLMPRQRFPPQHVMDSDPLDGPYSVAYNLQPSVSQIASKRPSPHTPQYLRRIESKFTHPAMREALAPPGHSSDVCGYVQAAFADEANAATNKEELDRFCIGHNEARLVYACISGWVLMFWRSGEDFEAGIRGARGSPRPLMWWDLREAWDVDVDFLDFRTEVCPHRIRIMMKKGNLYFRVEQPEDVPVWYLAIRRLVQDYAWHRVQVRDTELHQIKRWPAAKGLGNCLLTGSPIGERALAIAFHCYDIDYDCELRVGEIMVFLQELLAAMIADEGRAEGSDRNTAVMSAESRLPADELYDRAVRFQRTCCGGAMGFVKKDDFINQGYVAMLEAMDLGGPADAGDGGGASCVVM